VHQVGYLQEHTHTHTRCFCMSAVFIQLT